MKTIVLCVTVLFFGIVKPKAQNVSATNATMRWAAPVKASSPFTTTLYNKQQAGTRNFPIELLDFKGCIRNKRVSLEWSIARNESAERFEVEKSSDGKDFKTTGLVFSSEKAGIEEYAFFENSLGGKIFYRLKLVDKSSVAAYSKILTVYNEKKQEVRRLLKGNKPVYC